MSARIDEDARARRQRRSGVGSVRPRTSPGAPGQQPWKFVPAAADAACASAWVTAFAVGPSFCDWTAKRYRAHCERGETRPRARMHASSLRASAVRCSTPTIPRTGTVSGMGIRWWLACAARLRARGGRRLRERIAARRRGRRRSPFRRTASFRPRRSRAHRARNRQPGLSCTPPARFADDSADLLAHFGATAAYPADLNYVIVRGDLATFRAESLRPSAPRRALRAPLSPKQRDDLVADLPRAMGAVDPRGARPRRLASRTRRPRPGRQPGRTRGRRC